MNHPFVETELHDIDRQLIGAAFSGDKAALQQLVLRHQEFIYNVAWKMVLNPQDAEDITQEVWIKAITHLSSFEGRSSFRTWLYRIAFNHMLRMKRRPMENAVTNSPEYFDALDHMTDVELSPETQIEMAETIEDVKISCTAGMLLCLDREQRMVYILGEIFRINHAAGSEILRISPDNYRQRLSRARRDLTQWMHRKCGLVNSDNPCRCARKTRAFMEQGWVDPDRIKLDNHSEETG